MQLYIYIYIVCMLNTIIIFKKNEFCSYDMIYTQNKCKNNSEIVTN